MLWESSIPYCSAARQEKSTSAVWEEFAGRQGSKPERVDGGKGFRYGGVSLASLPKLAATLVSGCLRAVVLPPPNFRGCRLGARIKCLNRQQPGRFSRTDLLMHRQFRLTVGLVLLLALSPWLYVKAKGDKGEAVGGTLYQVKMRLRLDANRSQRVKLFRELVARLKAAGFNKDPGLEGEEFYGDLISGTVRSNGLMALRRETAIDAAVAIPEGYQAPETGALVRLYLLPAFGPQQQRELADKVRGILGPLGFKEAVGYHHDQHRQLVGRLPSGSLENLLTDACRADVPVVPASGSLRSIKQSLIKLAVVLAEPADLPPAAAEAGPPAAELPVAKIHPDLRRLLGNEAGDKPLRLEIVLCDEPKDGRLPAELRDESLGLRVDGLLGNVVYGTLPAGNVASLVRWSGISDIRLPQVSQSVGPPCDYTAISRQPVEVEAKPDRWLRAGPGAKVLLLAAEFGDWQAEVGRGLPAGTRLIDLTAELSPDLKPAEMISGQKAGLDLALDIARHLQGGELILVRIDPAAPFQVAEVARVLNGKLWQTGAFTQRLTEISEERARLAARKSQIDVKRRLALRNFGLEGDDKAARDAFRQEEAKYVQDLAALNDKDQRALAFRRAVQTLHGASTVLVGLEWDPGYALSAGATFLGRVLAPEILRSASWVQAMARRPGQTWTGLFVDEDQDGANDFAAQGVIRNLAFLSWHGEKTEALLPAGAVISATVVWEEAHDPRYASSSDDPYRLPLARLRLVVLRQRDPSGQRLPADIFDVVASSSAIPERLDNTPRSAVYRAEVRFAVPQPGRYALRLEGQLPISTLPPGAPVATEERIEIRPLLRIQVVDPATRSRGWPIFDQPK